MIFIDALPSLSLSTLSSLSAIVQMLYLHYPRFKNNVITNIFVCTCKVYHQIDLRVRACE